MRTGGGFISTTGPLKRLWGDYEKRKGNPAARRYGEVSGRYLVATCHRCGRLEISSRVKAGREPAAPREDQGHLL